jgi:hypothetical protein
MADDVTPAPLIESRKIYVSPQLGRRTIFEVANCDPKQRKGVAAAARANKLELASPALEQMRGSVSVSVQSQFAPKSRIA